MFVYTFLLPAFLCLLILIFRKVQRRPVMESQVDPNLSKFGQGGSSLRGNLANLWEVVDMLTSSTDFKVQLSKGLTRVRFESSRVRVRGKYCRVIVLSLSNLSIQSNLGYPQTTLRHLENPKSI